MDEWKKTEKHTEIRESPEGGATRIDVEPENSTEVIDEDTVDEERETEVHDLADDRADSER